MKIKTKIGLFLLATLGGVAAFSLLNHPEAEAATKTLTFTPSAHRKLELNSSTYRLNNHACQIGVYDNSGNFYGCIAIEDQLGNAYISADGYTYSGIFSQVVKNGATLIKVNFRSDNSLNDNVIRFYPQDQNTGDGKGFITNYLYGTKYSMYDGLSIANIFYGTYGGGDYPDQLEVKQRAPYSATFDYTNLKNVKGLYDGSTCYGIVATYNDNTERQLAFYKDKARTQKQSISLTTSTKTFKLNFDGTDSYMDFNGDEVYLWHSNSVTGDYGVIDDPKDIPLNQGQVIGETYKLNNRDSHDVVIRQADSATNKAVWKSSGSENYVWHFSEKNNADPIYTFTMFAIDDNGDQKNSYMGFERTTTTPTGADSRLNVKTGAGLRIRLALPGDVKIAGVKPVIKLKNKRSTNVATMLTPTYAFGDGKIYANYTLPTLTGDATLYFDQELDAKNSISFKSSTYLDQAGDSWQLFKDGGTAITIRPKDTQYELKEVTRTNKYIEIPSNTSAKFTTQSANDYYSTLRTQSGEDKVLFLDDQFSVVGYEDFEVSMTHAKLEKLDVTGTGAVVEKVDNKLRIKNSDSSYGSYFELTTVGTNLNYLNKGEKQTNYNDADVWKVVKIGADGKSILMMPGAFLTFKAYVPEGESLNITGIADPFVDGSYLGVQAGVMSSLGFEFNKTASTSDFFYMFLKDQNGEVISYENFIKDPISGQNKLTIEYSLDDSNDWVSAAGAMVQGNTILKAGANSKVKVRFSGLKPNEKIQIAGFGDVATITPQNNILTMDRKNVAYVASRNYENKFVINVTSPSDIALTDSSNVLYYDYNSQWNGHTTLTGGTSNSTGVSYTECENSHLCHIYVINSNKEGAKLSFTNYANFMFRDANTDERVTNGTLIKGTRDLTLNLEGYKLELGDIKNANAEIIKVGKLTGDNIPRYIPSGDTVTVKIEPTYLHQFKNAVLTDKQGNTVALTAVNDPNYHDQYTFTMPARDSVLSGSAVSSGNEIRVSNPNAGNIDSAAIIDEKENLEISGNLDIRVTNATNPSATDVAGFANAASTIPGGNFEVQDYIEFASVPFTIRGTSNGSTPTQRWAKGLFAGEGNNTSIVHLRLSDNYDSEYIRIIAKYGEGDYRVLDAWYYGMADRLVAFYLNKYTTTYAIAVKNEASETKRTVSYSGQNVTFASDSDKEFVYDPAGTKVTFKPIANEGYALPSSNEFIVKRNGELVTNAVMSQAANGYYELLVEDGDYSIEVNATKQNSIWYFTNDNSSLHLVEYPSTFVYSAGTPITFTMRPAEGYSIPDDKILFFYREGNASGDLVAVTPTINRAADGLITVSFVPPADRDYNVNIFTVRDGAETTRSVIYAGSGVTFSNTTPTFTHSASAKVSFDVAANVDYRIAGRDNVKIYRADNNTQVTNFTYNNGHVEFTPEDADYRVTVTASPRRTIEYLGEGVNYTNLQSSFFFGETTQISFKVEYANSSDAVTRDKISIKRKDTSAEVTDFNLADDGMVTFTPADANYVVTVDASGATTNQNTFQVQLGLAGSDVTASNLSHEVINGFATVPVSETYKVTFKTSTNAAPAKTRISVKDQDNNPYTDFLYNKSTGRFGISKGEAGKVYKVTIAPATEEDEKYSVFVVSTLGLDSYPSSANVKLTEAYTATITADKNHEKILKSDIEVSTTNGIAAEGSEYTFNEDTGEFRIPAQSSSKAFWITVNARKKAPVSNVYYVQFSLAGSGVSSPNQSHPIVNGKAEVPTGANFEATLIDTDTNETPLRGRIVIKDENNKPQEFLYNKSTGFLRVAPGDAGKTYTITILPKEQETEEDEYSVFVTSTLGLSQYPSSANKKLTEAYTAKIVADNNHEKILKSDIEVYSSFGYLTEGVEYTFNENTGDFTIPAQAQKRSFWLAVNARPKASAEENVYYVQFSLAGSGVSSPSQSHGIVNGKATVPVGTGFEATLKDDNNPTIAKSRITVTDSDNLPVSFTFSESQGILRLASGNKGKTYTIKVVAAQAPVETEEYYNVHVISTLGLDQYPVSKKMRKSEAYTATITADASHEKILKTDIRVTGAAGYYVEGTDYTFNEDTGLFTIPANPSYKIYQLRINARPKSSNPDVARHTVSAGQLSDVARFEPIEVRHGEKLTLTIQPNDGFEVLPENLSITGSNGQLSAQEYEYYPETNTIVIKAVNSDITIAATGTRKSGGSQDEPNPGDKPGDKPGQDQPGQDKPGQDQPGQDQPGQDEPGQDKPGTDEDKPGSDFEGKDEAETPNTSDTAKAPLFVASFAGVGALVAAFVLRRRRA